MYAKIPRSQGAVPGSYRQDITHGMKAMSSLCRIRAQQIKPSRLAV